MTTDRAEMYEYMHNGITRYGAECRACEWNSASTSTMRTMAQGDADKHNAEQHSTDEER